MSNGEPVSARQGDGGHGAGNMHGRCLMKILSGEQLNGSYVIVHLHPSSTAQSNRKLGSSHPYKQT